MPLTTSIDVPATDTAGKAPLLPSAPHSGVLLCLPSLPEDVLGRTLTTIAEAFTGESVTISTPTPPEDTSRWPNLQLLATAPEEVDGEGLGWVLAASDFASASSTLQSPAASGVAAADIKVLLLLANQAPDAALPDAQLLRSLADCIRNSKADLALPRYASGPTDGLVNSALIYPLTRSLFGADVRFALPVEAALSPRMAARLAVPAQRQVSLSQGSTLLWPVSEAAIAGMSVREVATAQASPQRSPQEDFNALFASVAGSLFNDIETKANFWQRARTLQPRAATPALSPLPHDPTNEDAVATAAQIAEMIESFRLAYSNLQEIWSLVLPPQSRLALKKLSLVPTAEFSLEPALWARIVYDFTLSFHLRTLNRGHLLGAMVPLYLAWVASHLNIVGDQQDRADDRIEATAAAFESEKSYLVARWRWPDRFNP